MTLLYTILALLVLIVTISIITARKRRKQNETPQLDNELFEKEQQA